MTRLLRKSQGIFRRRFPRALRFPIFRISTGLCVSFIDFRKIKVLRVIKLLIEPHRPWKRPERAAMPTCAGYPKIFVQIFENFLVDPMANPQNMMNLLNLVQQQQHQAAAHHHAQQQAREQKPVKAEESKQQEPSENRNQSPSASVEQTLLDQLSMQFNGVSSIVFRPDC